MHQLGNAQLAYRAVGPAQRHRPGPRALIERAADELGARPDVELHRLGVALQPAGEHVLGHERRPRRRERQVRQRVGPHLVVQGQRVVTVAPVVTNAGVALHDERVDADPAQPGGERQPGLPAPHDQDLGVVPGVALRLAPLVEPVVAGEVVGVLHAGRAAGADRLLVPAQLLQRGQQHPGGRRLPGQQPDERGAVPGGGSEVDKALDHVAAAAAHQSRRQAIAGEAEVARPGRRGGLPQRSLDLRPPGEGPVRPLERQDVAPVAVHGELARDLRRVAAGQRGGERLDPARQHLGGLAAGRRLHDIHGQSSPCPAAVPIRSRTHPVRQRYC